MSVISRRACDIRQQARIEAPLIDTAVCGTFIPEQPAEGIELEIAQAGAAQAEPDTSATTNKKLTVATLNLVDRRQSRLPNINQPRATK